MSKDEVPRMIHSFPKGTSCGRDGLRAQHLKDMLGGAASAIADSLLCSITKVVDLLLSGKCPSVLGSFISSAPLTPLVKPRVVFVLLQLVRYGGGLYLRLGRRLLEKLCTTILKIFSLGLAHKGMVSLFFILLTCSLNAKVTLLVYPCSWWIFKMLST